MAGREEKDPRLMELEKKARGRQPYVYEGSVVYEWEQNQDEVHIYVKLPPGCTKANQLSIILGPKRVQLSLRGASQLYLNHVPAGLVDKDDSTWFIEDGEVHIILAKARKAELWPSCFEGQAQLDAFTQNEVSKKLMLERFQEEHPGFDFSGADFNGNVPNAREFMGGMADQRPSILDRLKSGLSHSTATKASQDIKEQWFDMKANTALQWQQPQGTKDRKAPGSPSFRSCSLLELPDTVQPEVAVGGPRGILRTSRPESRRPDIESTSTTTVGEDASVTDWPTDSSVITQSRASSATGSRVLYSGTLEEDSVEMKSVEEVLKRPSRTLVGLASRQEGDGPDEFVEERWLPTVSRQRRKSVDPTWAITRVDDTGPTVRLDLSYQMLSSSDGMALVKGKGNIQEIDLSCNNLTSFVFTEGSDWRKLVTLDLSSCMLTELSAARDCWPPQLKRLSVADNSLRSFSGGALPRTLEILECQRNRLESLEGVEVLNRLIRLDASHNSLGSEAIDNALKPLRNLMVIDLGNNRIDKIGSGTLLGLRALKELWLDANSIRSISFIPKGNSLSVISVACNRLRSLKGLPKCPQLIELYLSRNRLCTVEGIAEVCPSLEVLELADNRLEEGRPVAKELSNLVDLAELTISGNPCSLLHSCSAQGLYRCCGRLAVLDGIPLRGSHRKAKKEELPWPLPVMMDDTDRPTTAESMAIQDRLRPMLSGFWDEDKLREKWTNAMHRTLEDLDSATKRLTSSAEEDLEKMSKWLAEAQAVIEKGAYLTEGHDQWEQDITVDASDV
ncbi:hypothetical protein FOL47_004075 [Perkinsus chesapeaki]|uniref:CS domain-containing protein n=1 Tax=Perkinsus chesapeaki TaxID=330153 RepID=A0A7J6M4P2_PERCH|nr:hypothetical protein FOL47_004075 [Perkinsus chesapeaki]